MFVSQPKIHWTLVRHDRVDAARAQRASDYGELRTGGMSEYRDARGMNGIDLTQNRDFLRGPS